MKADWPPYFRCPRCDIVTAPVSVAHVASPTHRPSWTSPVDVMCPICKDFYVITREDLLDLDACTSCPECKRRFEVPGLAEIVRCAVCGYLGPGRLPVPYVEPEVQLRRWEKPAQPEDNPLWTGLQGKIGSTADPDG
jgi:hypothetical protein